MSQNDSNVVLDDSNVILDDSNVILNDSNVILDNSNIILNDSNVILDDSNVILNDSNVILDDSNVILDDSNVILDDSNVILDDSNVILDDSNVVLDDSNVVLDDSNIVYNVILDNSNVIYYETSNIIYYDDSNIRLNDSNIVLDDSNIIYETCNIVYYDMMNNPSTLYASVPIVQAPVEPLYTCVDSIESFNYFYNMNIVETDYIQANSNLMIRRCYEVINKKNKYINLFISNVYKDGIEESNISKFLINNKECLNNECWSNIDNIIYDWANDVLTSNSLQSLNYLPCSCNCSLAFECNDYDINISQFNADYSMIVRNIELNSPYNPTHWFIYFDIFARDNADNFGVMSMVLIDKELTCETMNNLLDKAWNNSKCNILNEVSKRLL